MWRVGEYVQFQHDPTVYLITNMSYAGSFGSLTYYVQSLTNKKSHPCSAIAIKDWLEKKTCWYVSPTFVGWKETA